MTAVLEDASLKTGTKLVPEIQCIILQYIQWKMFIKSKFRCYTSTSETYRTAPQFLSSRPKHSYYAEPLNGTEFSISCSCHTDTFLYTKNNIFQDLPFKQISGPYNQWCFSMNGWLLLKLITVNCNVNVVLPLTTQFHQTCLVLLTYPNQCNPDDHESGMARSECHNSELISCPMRN